MVNQAGKIAWIGNPLVSLDKDIEVVLAGKFESRKVGNSQRKKKRKTRKE